MISNGSFVNDGEIRVLSRSCSAGKKILGGGVLYNNSGSTPPGGIFLVGTGDFTVIVSGPISDTQWAAIVRNNSGQGVTFFAYAICANVF